MVTKLSRIFLNWQVHQVVQIYQCFNDLLHLHHQGSRCDWHPVCGTYMCTWGLALNSLDESWICLSLGCQVQPSLKPISLLKVPGFNHIFIVSFTFAYLLIYLITVEPRSIVLACTVCHFWSRMKSHINNVIFSHIHRSPNYHFTTLIICKSRSRRSISRMDCLKKKLKWSNYYLRYLSLDYKSGNTVMQSRFARGPQLRVRIISVISELYFVVSGSVLSHVISSVWFICFH